MLGARLAPQVLPWICPGASQVVGTSVLPGAPSSEWEGGRLPLHIYFFIPSPKKVSIVH